jgi:hypothetical protein
VAPSLVPTLMVSIGRVICYASVMLKQPGLWPPTSNFSTGSEEGVVKWPPLYRDHSRIA